MLPNATQSRPVLLIERLRRILPRTYSPEPIARCTHPSKPGVTELCMTQWLRRLSRARPARRVAGVPRDERRQSLITYPTG